MTTAIILLTAWVIAVIIYASRKERGKHRLEEQESIKWARKWNEQREKEKAWCDGGCSLCNYTDNCPFSEVAR
jgi:hypothetical protein